MIAIGRLPSEARQRVQAELSLVHGDYMLLSERTGLPHGVVQRILAELRRMGATEVIGTVNGAGRGRPRAIYAPHKTHTQGWMHLCHAWR